MLMLSLALINFLHETSVCRWVARMFVC